MSGLVLDKVMVGKPKEKYWVTYIKRRIAHNKNFLGFISGPTGSGKSWSSLSIAEDLDPEFNIERVVFSGIELMNLINSDKLKKGSVIVFEEAGIGLSNKNWQSTMNKMLNFLVQTFRHRNFILIFNSPYMDFVDASTRKLFHAEFEAVGINQKTKCVKLKARLIQYNGRLRKFYYKMLRVTTSKGVLPIDLWNVPKPSSELIKNYEVRKREFTDELNNTIQAELEAYDEKTSMDYKKKLTLAQQNVLDCLKEGMVVDEIANKYDIKPGSVRSSMRYMRKKGYEFNQIKPNKSNNVIRYEVKCPE